jgi:hypothetical protein
MAKDRDNVRIYGDDASGVYVGDKGTTGPTTLAAPGVGFDEVGWLSEDGVDFDRSEDVAEFKGWQGGTTLRKKVTSQEDTFRFVCLEETALTMGLYYKGVAPTTATGVDTFAITNQAVSDERAWVVDVVDDTITKRYVIPSGEITGRATVPHKNSDLTMYEFTVTIYGDYSILKTAAA